MKKMKRLVAVLLAGVMALAILTACGGSKVSLGEQLEKKYFEVFNAARSEEKGELSNDPELSQMALKALETIDKDGKIAEENVFQRIGPTMDEETGKYIEITVKVATEERSSSLEMYTAKAVTPEMIAGMSAPDQRLADSYSRIAIATLERNGKTYYALAYEEMI